VILAVDWQSPLDRWAGSIYSLDISAAPRGRQGLLIPMTHRRPESPCRAGVRGTLLGGTTLNLPVKILVMIGSTASISLGIWHFFVPALWNWNSYIAINATELVVAVRALNVFFSLSLVLFGALNILFVLGDRSNRYSVIVILTATCILWLTRLAFQIIYPQGSMNNVLQYGTLSAFIIVSLCYMIPLYIVVSQRIVS
jgi:hypothetical protein